MNKNRIFAILALVLAASLMFSMVAFADDTNWRYDASTKTLYISGSGAMEDYENSYSAPWNAHILDIENLVVEEGVTTVGAYALSGAAKLSSVSLADSVTAIKQYAFASCPTLTALELSSKVTSIADYSFAYNGIEPKADFTLSAPAGSYALHYAMKNNKTSDNKIAVQTEKITCGDYTVHITASGGMYAYYPYTPLYDGTFNFYSTGSHDSRGYVFNSEYKQIAYNDDGGSSTNFSIQSLALEQGKTYYFAAKIMNSSLTGKFDIHIEPVEFTLSGTFYAMNDPSGAASNIVVTEATVDGEATDGTYTRTVGQDNADVHIVAGHKEFDYHFTPDKAADIVIMMCDMNNDGYVNGRDYAIMKTTDSKYKPLFADFIGYEE